MGKYIIPLAKPHLIPIIQRSMVFNGIILILALEKLAKGPATPKKRFGNIDYPAAITKNLFELINV